MEKIEEVKKILEEYHYETLATKDINDITLTICQLFEPKFNNPLEADAHNWDTREVEPDKDRLLKD